VTNVCGTCHAVFAQKFETSVHAQIFDKGCVECHGNHAVLKPTDEMLGPGANAICAGCHVGPDDSGAKAAAAMRKAIETLKTAIDGSTTVVARVGNAGIEVSAEELALAEARAQLTLARTEMHAFDPARVDGIVETGLKIVGEVDRAGEAAAAELAYRRRGLAWSLAAILLFVVALGFKIRQLDRRTR
jgi:predicted CXXCH cytochrome family protein